MSSRGLSFPGLAPDHEEHEHPDGIGQSIVVTQRLSSKKVPLVFLDLEATDLDALTNHILEVAIIITSADLREIARYHAVIHQPDEVLESMNEYCTEMHRASGLIELSRASNKTTEDVDQEIVNFLRVYCGEYVEAGVHLPLAGASVHMDLRWVERHFPETRKLLVHRVVDVTTIIELAKRWKSRILKHFPRSRDDHRAMAAVELCLNRLRYLQQHFFKL
ncbi:Oligoribonuclease like protein [Aduncisulcus paluster]|uniref:Oligoribonuclease like protein n=1 Tax=Aduncisulcus paluster TaxID=2918883 RepID=A0ABQ5KI34_9EUKA|nr:Oligoribonuclease like protein [Aduncisulcus paluster]